MIRYAFANAEHYEPEGVAQQVALLECATGREIYRVTHSVPVFKLHWG